MNTTTVKQLAALRPDAAKRAMTNIHLTATELAHFKTLAKACRVNFSGLTRAALRALEQAINEESHHE